ncbi:hypothetical protein [Aliicoccus persicus]|uniref:Uncharacterized protein n=1 Tax=Aliicoccus persicus TaxID=930138 RepID=A0A662Z6U6_9STAP|nr:hypothetical protein [Aliicoccus persicus]SEW12308.1 hypothetical protein SAMN05192557_1738 [Aliicoccus persicus]
MKQIILKELWRYLKLFVISTGIGMVSLLIARDAGYIDEEHYLTIVPYMMIIFLIIMVCDFLYRYLVRKVHMSIRNSRARGKDSIMSPLPIIAMVFTSVTVLNSAMIILGFDTPIEGPEAFIQMILLIILIAILVGMLLSSHLKSWYINFDKDQLFSRFVESGGKYLFRWTSILFAIIVVGLGLITLILSITLNIETGLAMHETFIKIYGSVVALGLIAKFLAYRKRMEIENSRLK